MLMKTGMRARIQRCGTTSPMCRSFVGYCLYGLGAVLFTIALRDGELSVLYPVISLTYVWVAILSVPILHEKLSISHWKGASKASAS